MSLNTQYIREPWISPKIPNNFKQTIFHLLRNNAYWVKDGVTVGHFITQYDSDTFYSSKRGDLPNDILELGPIIVKQTGIEAMKPSMIHFHCPLKDQSKIRYELVDYNGILCIYFANHGPNLYFDIDIDENQLIEFIDENFSLDKHTTGLDL
jgi:hypothetical protein